jgi:hypothetical protein
MEGEEMTIDRTHSIRLSERDDKVRAFHVDRGLKCPVCAGWSPVSFDSPQGVRLECGDCGAVAVMPRVQLVRAIKRTRPLGTVRAKGQVR